LFRFQQIILVDEFNLISRQTNLNNEAIERKTLKTNFESETFLSETINLIQLQLLLKKQRNLSLKYN
jgi:hypothetical protein